MLHNVKKHKMKIPGNIFVRGFLALRLNIPKIIRDTRIIWQPVRKRQSSYNIYIIRLVFLFASNEMRRSSRVIAKPQSKHEHTRFLTKDNEHNFVNVHFRYYTLIYRFHK